MKITCGLIGYGYWGEILLRNLVRKEEFSVKKIGDININNLQNLNSIHPEITVTDNISEILQDSDIKAVVISTLASTHYSIVKEALLKGKHVLVEKPFTCSYSEAMELHELANKKNRVLMIDHILLYTEAAAILKKFINENEISDISFQRLNNGRIPTDTNVIWDLAPHDLSMISYITDKIPYSVEITSEKKSMERIEAASFILNYPSGLRASFKCAWANKEKSRKTTINGNGISLIYDESLNNNKKIRIEDFRNKNNNSYYIPLKSSLLPMGNMMKDFANCINSNAVPLSSSAMGLIIINIIEALNESALHKGKEINLDLINESNIIH